MKIYMFLMVLVSSTFAEIIVEPFVGYNYDILIDRDDATWQKATVGMLLDYNGYKFVGDFFSDTRYELTDNVIEGTFTAPIKNRVWVSLYGSYGVDEEIIFSQNYTFYLNVTTKLAKGLLLGVQYDEKDYTSANISAFSLNPIYYFSFFRTSYKIAVNKLVNEDDLDLGHLVNFTYYHTDDDNVGIFFGYNPEYERDARNPEYGFLETNVMDIGLKGQKKIYNFYLSPLATYTIADNRYGTAYEKIGFGLFLKYRFGL